MNAAAPQPAAKTRRVFNIVDGEAAEAADGRTLEAFGPSDGTVIAVMPRSGAEDVDRAVAAARRAFEEGPWGRMTATERGRLLVKLGEAILAHQDELAILESMDTGKPARQGKADIVATARYFEFYGTAADKVHGETIPFLNGYTVAVVRDPHGVTGHIVPWNYPAQIFGRSVAASLACGNTCVVKPAEDACLSLIRISELALEVGFPPGVLNLVTGLGEEAGAALSSHRGIDFISFTGSPEVGTLIQTAAAKNHIGCTLELGGKSPQILFADADFDAAVPVLVNAIVQNGGQTCSAGSRMLVERKAYDELVGRVAERFRTVRVGSWDMDLDLGPMINAGQKRRVEGFVERARADGIPVLAEGVLADGLPAGGHYVAPTLFGPVPRSNRLACDEVFGPVLSAIPFDDEADAIRLANGTDFGLVAGVWSREAKRSMRVARAMRCGQVFVNGYGAGGGIELPFGGVKKSGHGREKGFEALYEFSASKTVVINHG
ncbi:aldehyde dehydrogenase family protein [Phreatobacter sp. AB_2022a]|uniref:aldehyde dehydrogenase family protein n=1 Tax=Phreatobacter sp. AB_2022a TaxID=3003134 RepID=UPI0022874085|nr:aldehyde dehydrogenase family protein [Phreatobacter sp. AB_2022a]MCZ0738738.1 aldehyde dehydrogenase family protein [Phreatobacter sp. AB_2022a]